MRLFLYTILPSAVLLILVLAVVYFLVSRAIDSTYKIASRHSELKQSKELVEANKLLDDVDHLINSDPYVNVVLHDKDTEIRKHLHLSERKSNEIEA